MKMNFNLKKEFSYEVRQNTIIALIALAIVIFVAGWIINANKSYYSNENPNNLSSTSASSGAQQNNQSARKSGADVIINISASWKSNGEYYKQYDIKINNTADTDIVDWTLKIPNVISAGIVQYWNCKVVKDDENIVVTPGNYSGKIKSRSTSLGIGFTLKSASDYKLSEYTLKVIRADLVAREISIGFAK